MNYRWSGQIEALPGPDCRETLAGVTLRLSPPKPGAKLSLTILSTAHGPAARETRWLADTEFDHDGRCAVARTADPPALLQPCQGRDA